MKTYGEIVRETRKAKAMQLQQLARKVGAPKGYISAIETGYSHPPSPKVTAKIARVLGLDNESMQILAWAEKAPKCVRERVLKTFRK